MEASLELLRLLEAHDCCCLTYLGAEETKEGADFVDLQDSHELLPAAEGTQASTHRAAGVDGHLTEEMCITLRSVSVQYLLCMLCLLCCDHQQDWGFRVCWLSS